MCPAGFGDDVVLERQPNFTVLTDLVYRLMPPPRVMATRHIFASPKLRATYSHLKNVSLLVCPKENSASVALNRVKMRSKGPLFLPSKLSLCMSVLRLTFDRNGLLEGQSFFSLSTSFRIVLFAQVLQA